MNTVLTQPGAPMKVRGIQKRFGAFTALDNVSLDVAAGELVCLLGPSGCGKTTLLRCIAGLERQDSGELYLGERDVSLLPPQARDYGILFQSYALFPNLTVEANIGYGLTGSGRDEVRKRVGQMLELVGLLGSEKKYPGQLSGGQQQRVALARALAPAPSLLLLDEPMSALDARVREHLCTELRQLQRRLGITTLMVTHNQDEAMLMADRIAVMNNGKVEQYATPQEIYNCPVIHCWPNWPRRPCRAWAPRTSGSRCRHAACRCLPEMAAVMTLPMARRASRAELGDRLFVLGGKWLWLCLLGVAVLLPLLAIFWRGFSSEAGQGGGLVAARELVSSANFHWLLGNSLKVSLSVAAIVVPLAYLFAYALQRTLIPAKAIWRGLSLLPLMAPSMLPGIALVYLFGNQGLLRGLLSDNIYGFWGIVLGEVIYTFPHALMILLSALSLADARLFDAASSMGASPARAFRSITWPATRQAVFAAFCLVFTLTITDFGVPVVVGGDYQVLALEAYKAVVGQQQFGRGALIGMVLLLPALFSFGVDAWLRRRQGDAMGGRAQVFQPAPSRRRDACYLAIVLLICAVLLLVFGMAVYSSLVKFWPYNLSLSLNHYQFEDTAGGGWLAYRNSLTLALFTALIGSVLIFTGAYLMEKTQGQKGLNLALRMLSFVPMAVPGLVLGLGYVFFFNLSGNPLHVFYGTMTLLVVCTIAHYLTTAQMTATTALRQLDAEFEAAALSLKAPLYRHYLRVTVPICLPALLDIVRYLFVSAMTTVSAAIFLYSPDTILAAVAVLNMDDAGNVGGAAAMSTLILFTSAGVSLLLAWASRGVLRRSQAWRQTAPGQ